MTRGRLLIPALLVALAGCSGGTTSASTAATDEPTDDPVVAETTPDATEEATTAEPVAEATTEKEPSEETSESGMSLPSEVALPEDAPTLPPSEAMSDEEFVAALEAYLTPFFIVPEELGPTWVAAPWEPSGGAGLCGIDVDAEVPPYAHFGTLLTPTDAELALEEEFRVYETLDSAAAAIAIGRESLSCGENTADPSQGTLSEVVDLTDVVGAEAFGVGVTGEGFEGGLVVALVSDTLVSFEFIGATGAAEAFGADDPAAVAAYGVEKLVMGFENS